MSNLLNIYNITLERHAAQQNDANHGTGNDHLDSHNSDVEWLHQLQEKEPNILSFQGNSFFADLGQITASSEIYDARNCFGAGVAPIMEEAVTTSEVPAQRIRNHNLWLTMQELKTFGETAQPQAA